MPPKMEGHYPGSVTLIGTEFLPTKFLGQGRKWELAKRSPIMARLHYARYWIKFRAGKEPTVMMECRGFSDADRNNTELVIDELCNSNSIINPFNEFSALKLVDGYEHIMDNNSRARDDMAIGDAVKKDHGKHPKNGEFLVSLSRGPLKRIFSSTPHAILDMKNNIVMYSPALAFSAVIQGPSCTKNYDLMRSRAKSAYINGVIKYTEGMKKHSKKFTMHGWAF